MMSRLRFLILGCLRREGVCLAMLLQGLVLFRAPLVHGSEVSTPRGQLSPAQVASPSVEASPSTPLSVAAQAAAEAKAAYLLESGDDLEIKVYNIPELNATVRVRPDGKISLLLLNDVQAANLTTEQLTDVLSAGYAKYYHNPRVAVIVQSFSSMNVYVGGEVGHPGLIPLRGNITALQAVVQAGGLTETSRRTSLLVLRHLDTGAPQLLNLNVDEILANRAADVVLGASDVVYVPKTNISVYVGGEVAHPGLLPLNGELTATAAVFQAGGFRETAKTNMLLLLRDSGKGSPIVTKLRLDDVLKGKPDTVLQPFDVIYAPKSKIGKIDKFVDQYIRQVIPLGLSGGFSYVLGSTIVTH
jgi:protein involved in polysaccharide export with SLBB domain